MIHFFETIILLSLTGSVSVIMLLLLKLFLLKRFSGNGQKILWTLALLSMLIPMWMFIPKENIEPIVIPYYNNHYEERELINTHESEVATNDRNDIKTPQKPQLDLDYEIILALVWLCGATLFVTVTITSYIKFLAKKKNSIDCTENTVLEKVKESLKNSQNSKKS